MSPRTAAQASPLPGRSVSLSNHDWCSTPPWGQLRQTALSPKSIRTNDAGLEVRQFAAFRVPTLRAGPQTLRLEGLFAVEGVAVGGAFDSHTATVAMPMRTASPAC